MTAAELLELRQITLSMQHELFKAELMERNTAVIPNGQEAAKQQRAIATLLVNARTEWISFKITELGYPVGTNCSVDIQTGEIKPV
ncbi:hypothetical protein [Bradyrhizobium elkanii]|uniref:hypothetical protein n=1 Tax=Bradyrhizobium elkanii TaxID=29448 RepID=UPI003D24A436